MKWYLALGFVLALQMIMVLTQFAIADVGSDYIISDSATEHYASYGGENYTLSGDVMDSFPDSAGSVDENTGGVFTDSYRTGKSWLQGGRNSNFITAPYNLLKDLGAGTQVAWAISIFWYTFITALVLYQFLRGGA